MEHERVKVSAEILHRYDIPGPRYTSYPPAPHFHGEFTQADIPAALERSNGEGCRELSFYFHIPFCPHRCLYCGCTTEVARPGSWVKRYFAALKLEMERVLPRLDASRPVTQVHFGGGTPNGVPDRYLREILDRLRARFTFSPEAEVAIECDPNLVTDAKLVRLREMGFTRISYGLQDFSREVLKAVERGFPRIAPKELIARSHELGFRGLNLDLIYGLPLQTPASFEDTLRRTVDAAPDRVAIFSYAKVPWLMPHQQKLEVYPFPSPEEKMAMNIAALDLLQEAGYVAIGMDHYAKPDDDLALAVREHRLHRNFQGYCSRRTTGQVVAFGSSGISQLESSYIQNLKTSESWMGAVERGEWAIERVYFLTPQERLRRTLINRIMCEGRLDLDDLPRLPGQNLSDLEAIAADGWKSLDDLEADGLCHREGRVLTLTPVGHLLVRVVAMRFDPMLRKGPGRYSRTV